MASMGGGGQQAQHLRGLEVLLVDVPLCSQHARWAELLPHAHHPLQLLASIHFICLQVRPNITVSSCKYAKVGTWELIVQLHEHMIIASTLRRVESSRLFGMVQHLAKKVSQQESPS